ncbi:unnamed protein product [Brachionus calyciflorus]|uniref:Uncharacterized protein n=1 Tax=Brachionus calyciflorus TaxID=104777 RepID=A0A813WI98_9BILA|nr:unnamed protein product [Brachionus calyciflorus]
MENDRNLTKIKDDNQFYEKFAKDLIEDFFETSFGPVNEKTQQIDKKYSELNSRLDKCNNLICEKTNFEENYKKCLRYFEKAVNIKRDLIIINEKCIDLKRRAFQLKEDYETNKTKSLLQQQKNIEEEQKLYPKINPKLLATQQTEPSIEPAIITAQTIKVIKKNRHKPNSVNPNVIEKDEKSKINGLKYPIENVLNISIANLNFLQSKFYTIASFKRNKFLDMCLRFHPTYTWHINVF